MLRRKALRVWVGLVVAMVVTATAAAQEDMPPGGTFTDDDGNVHEGYIEAIAAEGVTRGCNPPDNDRYCPGESITRGQMAAFLNRALGLDASADDPFTDDDDSIFEADIAALAAAGITRGCNPPDNDNFCPDDPVTRGQMAAFLVRGFGYTDGGDDDLFVDDDETVFETDIDRLGTAGVTTGCNPPDNDRYCPSDLVERDQMASFLGRALELAPRTPPPVMVVAPYFFVDEDGHPGRSGPFLAPFHRRVAKSSTTAQASLASLLAGPSSDESSSIPTVTTFIPDGVDLNSVALDGGVATVDLSVDLGTSSQAVAQVVFTLTRFETIDSVRFLHEGAAVSVRTDNGAIVDRPVTRGDYLDHQASISVETPLYGGIASDPLRVTGQARVFEATFQYVLTDGEGRIIEEGLAMSGSGVDWAGFDFTIDYQVDRTQIGSLVVWTDSAEDGTRVDIREYPLLLQP